MLISFRHRQRYRKYYSSREFGHLRPHRWQSVVDGFVAELHAHSVLDYGCGPFAALAHYAPYPVQSYDPGLLIYGVRPEPADIVVCAHTLEHVEPEALDDVLADIRQLARKGIVCFVSCEPSTKVLPDGTPWHTIVESPAWWHGRLQATWQDVTVKDPEALGSLREYRSLWYVAQEGGADE